MPVKNKLPLVYRAGDKHFTLDQYLAFMMANGLTMDEASEQFDHDLRNKRVVHMPHSKAWRPA